MEIGQTAHPDHTDSPSVVLVVDDELFLLEYVRLVLVRSGFRVMTAKTGEEAWQLISNPENSISLVLTDIVMPGSFDGFELAERIRRRQLGVPVLFMGLHVFVSLLQAYVFMLLAMIYLSQAVAHEH